VESSRCAHSRGRHVGRVGDSALWSGVSVRPVMRAKYAVDMARSRITPLCLALVAFGAQAQHFPPLDRDNTAKSRTIGGGGGYSFCMTAYRVIPANSAQPLFTFNFAARGASGVALIDGTPVKTFKNEQHLLIRARVSKGDHRFVLYLDKAAENTFMSSSDDFKYCQPK
jgi:hypothetical protein